MVSYFLANIVMYVMELGLMKVFVRAVNIPFSYLFPQSSCSACWAPLL